MSGTPATSVSTSDTRSPGTSALVLVVAECLWGHIQKVTFELLGDARKLALSLKARVEVALLTSPSNRAGAIRELRPYVQERLQLVEHPLLQDYSTGTHVRAMELLLERISPNVVMLGATANGRDLGPRVAARLGMGYIPHCLVIRAGAERQLNICLLYTSPSPRD